VFSNDGHNLRFVSVVEGADNVFSQRRSMVVPLIGLGHALGGKVLCDHECVDARSACSAPVLEVVEAARLALHWLPSSPPASQLPGLVRWASTLSV